MLRQFIFATFLLSQLNVLFAEEAICRYCVEGGLQRRLPLGMKLEGKYHYAPDRQVDVQHIKIDVTPDFERQTIAATTTITAKPILKPQKILRLDAVNLRIQDVKCEQATIVDFVSTRDDLKIVFESELPVDQEFTVAISYTAKPEAGLYFRTPAMGYPESDTHIWTQGETHEARHWFPCFDYPNEKSSTEVICHVPNEMIVLSNGKKTSETSDSYGLKSVGWLQEKPHANYLVCLVAGKFSKLEDQYRDIPLGFYAQPSLAEHAENSFQDTRAIMEFFEQEIGIEYPWVKYDQVTIQDFSAGGMENTTLTTLTDNTIFSKNTENVYSSRGLVAHELAHQWFGDYVTCKDWSHLWLNEGFATYYTILYEEKAFGHDAMLYELFADATHQILKRGDDKRPIVYNQYSNSMEQFDYRSYPKGSWVLHMLRSQLREAAFRECIQKYLQQHALSSVVSDDLRKIIEDQTGSPMDQFFDQWLYHAGFPDLEIRYEWQADTKLAKVTIEQKQTVDDHVRLFAFPTKLRFIAGDQIVDQAIEVTKSKEDFYVSLEAQPQIVRFDPDFSVLARVSFEKSDDMWEAQLNNTSDMIGRLFACQAIGKRKPQNAVELLSNVVETDPFFGVRTEAAQALEQIGTDEAFDALYARVDKQTDARVRNAMTRIVANRYDSQAVSRIKKILETEKNPAIQATALRGLGVLQNQESRMLLLQFLKSDSFEDELAIAAISAIEQHRNADYIPALIETIERHRAIPTSKLLPPALRCLASIAASTQDKSNVSELLVSFLDSPKTVVRVSALAAIGTLGDSQSIPILESVQQSGHPQLRDQAAESLDKLRTLKPVAPEEIIKLREEVGDLRTNYDKLKSEIEDLRKLQKALP